MIKHIANALLACQAKKFYTHIGQSLSSILMSLEIQKSKRRVKDREKRVTQIDANDSMENKWQDIHEFHFSTVPPMTAMLDLPPKR